MSKVILEGRATAKRKWGDKGWAVDFETANGTITVGFSGMLRIPRKGLLIRLEATQGARWLFAQKWEYLEIPKGKTKDGFPVHSDPDIEKAAIKIINSLNEFTVDDFHSLEGLVKEKGRDLRVFGSILRTFKTRGLIKEVRIVHSKRIRCHKRPVVLWTRAVEKFDEW